MKKKLSGGARRAPKNESGRIASLEKSVETLQEEMRLLTRRDNLDDLKVRLARVEAAR